MDESGPDDGRDGLRHLLPTLTRLMPGLDDLRHRADGLPLAVLRLEREADGAIRPWGVFADATRSVRRPVGDLLDAQARSFLDLACVEAEMLPDLRLAAAGFSFLAAIRRDGDDAADTTVLVRHGRCAPFEGDAAHASHGPAIAEALAMLSPGARIDLASPASLEGLSAHERLRIEQEERPIPAGLRAALRAIGPSDAAIRIERHEEGGLICRLPRRGSPDGFVFAALPGA